MSTIGESNRQYTRYVNMKPEFLYRKYTFIVWKWLKIFYSKYCPSLAIHFSHLSSNWWMPRQKTVALLRQTSYRAIFVHFRKKWSAGQKVRVPSMQINSNRTEPSLVSKPRVCVFPTVCMYFPTERFNRFLDRFCCIWWCIIMKQNYFVLPFLIFWSFFTQSLIQIDHLLSVALSINGFTRF